MSDNPVDVVETMETEVKLWIAICDKAMKEKLFCFWEVWIDNNFLEMCSLHV
jgi:hypothetical protein